MEYFRIFEENSMNCLHISSAAVIIYTMILTYTGPQYRGRHAVSGAYPHSEAAETKTHKTYSCITYEITAEGIQL